MNLYNVFSINKWNKRENHSVSWYTYISWFAFLEWRWSRLSTLKHSSGHIESSFYNTNNTFFNQKSISVLFMDFTENSLKWSLGYLEGYFENIHELLVLKPHLDSKNLHRLFSNFFSQKWPLNHAELSESSHSPAKNVWLWKKLFWKNQKAFKHMIVLKKCCFS